MEDESVVTATTRCGLAKSTECGELLHRRFALKLKATVYKSYEKPAILHGSVAWCQKESKIQIS